MHGPSHTAPHSNMWCVAQTSAFDLKRCRGVIQSSRFLCVLLTIDCLFLKRGRWCHGVGRRSSSLPRSLHPTHPGPPSVDSGKAAAMGFVIVLETVHLPLKEAGFCWLHFKSLSLPMDSAIGFGCCVSFDDCWNQREDERTIQQATNYMWSDTIGNQMHLVTHSPTKTWNEKWTLQDSLFPVSETRIQH